jgi:hypothetical protein
MNVTICLMNLQRWGQEQTNSKSGHKIIDAVQGSDCQIESYGVRNHNRNRMQ